MKKLFLSLCFIVTLLAVGCSPCPVCEPCPIPEPSSVEPTSTTPSSVAPSSVATSNITTSSITPTSVTTSSVTPTSSTTSSIKPSPNTSLTPSGNPASGASYYATNQDDRYYQGIDDYLIGDALITALSTLTSTGFVGHSYSSLPSIYRYSDVTASNKMRMAYTGTEVTFSPGNMPGNTNKEHVWPASWYGNGKRTESVGSPGADAHNVWPCASSLNSKRGSCAYDVTSVWKCGEFDVDDYSYGNPSDPESFVYSSAKNKSNGQPTDVLYPAKGYRGAIARILMYVATRYRNDTTYPVMLHDRAETLKSGRIGKLSTLLKWHFEEPPAEWEITRNNEVASRWHHNRNPFVDHPEYAARIFYYLNEPDQSGPTNAVKNAIETYGASYL